MADPTFLHHLNDLRKTYRPHKREISPVVLNELEFYFKEIGKIVRDDNPHRRHKNVIKYLLYISTRCFDLLESGDYDKLFDDIAALHTAKNAGYAGVVCTDPWANFRTSYWFDVTPFVGCLIRMGDKFIRVTNLAKDPKADQVGESIKDTIQDLAVYCLVAICLWDEEAETIRCGGGRDL